MTVEDADHVCENLKRCVVIIMRLSAAFYRHCE
jgi:hypothetical protein